MPRLIYSMLTSLDGYVEDARGKFAWATPDEELHAYVNARFASVGTYLYGRRMYDTMVYWETVPLDGPELAAQAIRAGLVDEIQPIVCPVVVGGGKRFFPEGVRLDLELLEERRFSGGVATLRYAVRR